MKLYFPMMLFSLVVLVNARKCELTRCRGPYHLKEPVHGGKSLPIVAMTPTLFRFPDTLPVWMMTRWRYSQYCYSGPNWDPRTGCNKETKPLPPGREEARLWREKSQCQIGPTCPIKGDCWGSKAELCNTLTFGTWVEQKDFSFLNKEYSYFAYHTCNMDWSCHIKSVSFPLGVLMQSSSPRPYISLLNGTSLVLPLNGYYKDTEYSLLFTQPTESRVGDIEVSCVNQDILLCQVTKSSDPRVNRKIFQDIGNYVMVYRNYYFILTDKQAKGLFGSGHVRVVEKPGAGASLKDLLEVVGSLEHAIGVLYHNNMVLQQDIVNTSSLLVKVVSSLSKLDEELIGNVLGLDSVTKWFNDHLFNMCPCQPKPKMYGSNCDEDFSYQDGRYILRSKTKVDCVTYSTKSVRDMDLLMLEDPEKVVLSIDAPLGESSDYAGWAWLAQNKRGITDAITLTSMDGDPGKSLNDILSVPSLLTVIGAYSMPIVMIWTLINSIVLCVAIFSGAFKR